MQRNLTKGPITVNLLFFALPLMFGNLLQQLYNVADTWVVGRYLGADALAAVGSSYTLMTFLTSILLGLCMGSGAAISMLYGSGEKKKMRQSIFMAFCLIGAIALVINILVYLGMDGILWILRVPASIKGLMKDYLWVIFLGILATFLYNYFASLLRAAGESLIPLIFLAVCAGLNIVLDLWFVIGLDAGIAGAAVATVISQWISGIGIAVYTWGRCPQFRLRRRDFRITKDTFGEIFQFSFLTCVQQSVMNLGILMVQGLVNSFGPVVMAAFAAAVKIDSFAYMPVQDFGNAFSTFVAQNYGAGKQERIREGARKSVLLVLGFCLVISASVFVFAKQLLLIFVQPYETEILAVGIQYLRIEGVFYFGIGFLFLFYGYYRAVRKPGMSVVLTVISLGTRVVLAYVLSAVPQIGVSGIWSAVPIGWILADIAGWIYYKKLQQR